MHKIIGSDKYANICILQCTQGYLSGRVDKVDLPDLPVKRIEPAMKNEFWVMAVFQDGQSVAIQPFIWYESLNEAIQGESVYDYDPDIEARLWSDLCNAGLVTSHIPDPAKAAIEARKKLELAIAKFNLD
jgi:hypothetical protein